MNKVFDIKRFGKYLVYDMRRAQSQYLISGAILSALPLLCFVVSQIFSFVFNGRPSEAMSSTYATVAASIAVLIFVFTFPVKMYGEITSKQYGSSFLLLPASSFEKSLSMILTACVLVPLAIVAVFLCCDTLLSLCFSDTYGTNLIKILFGLKKELYDATEGALEIHLGLPVYLSFCNYMLCFCLGSIFFKRNKAAKTFLVLIALSSVFGSILGSIMVADIFGFEGIFDAFQRDFNADTVNSIMGWVNGTVYGLNILEFCLLSAGIYFRIKTLKH